MDLPPPGTQPPRVAVQQRPSISYLIFISLLFYLITSNNSDPTTVVPDESGLNRLRAELLRRVQRRDGLAAYLKLNATAAHDLPPSVLPSGLVFPNDDGTAPALNLSANDTLYAPTPFEPKSGATAVLLPRLHKLLDRDLGADTLYPQNVTGFVKGQWGMHPYSYEQLGIDEAYNTTTQVEREEVGKSNEAPPAEESHIVRRAQLGSDPSVASLGKRQVGALLGATVLANSIAAPQTSALPLRHLVNETTTHNRTTNRGPYPWTKGGKIVFNLREETLTEWDTISADEGEIVELNKTATKANWADQGPVTFLSGEVTLSSFDKRDDFVFDIEAAHLLSQGVVYGYVSPQNDRRSQLFNVPGLAILEEGDAVTEAGRVDAMGRMVLKQIDERIAKDKVEIEDHALEQPQPGQGGGQGNFAVDVAPCVFSFYGSIEPLPLHYSAALYLEYYRSLLHPSGSSLTPPPAPKMMYTMYSENCALVLEGEGTSLSSYRLWEQATSYATAMVLAQGLLLVLLVRQIEWGGTTGGGRIAYLTIGAQAAVDSYFFVVHFTIGVVTRNRSSLPLLVPAFFALLSSVIFGMRYASSIRAAQPSPIRPPPPPPAPVVEPAPLPTGEELAASAAERRAAGTAAAAEASAVEGDDAEATIPLLPAPAAPAPVPLFQPPPASELFYVAIAVGVLLFVFTVIMVGGWIPLILGIVFSYWIPQIVHNVKRSSARNSFRAEYIVGTTLARLALPIYFWGYEENVLSVETSAWINALVGYSILQAAILLSQNSRLGARWFIPQRLLDYWGLVEEEKWDYHPITLTADAEANAIEEDCPICLEKVELGSKEDRELGRGRRGYMVPPCNHIAHTDCLESWLAIKSVCPVCRGRLPPL